MTEKITALTQALCRPAVVLLLVGMVVGAVFTDQVDTFPEWLVGLILVVVPGYMGLRSLEKVVLPKINGSSSNGGPFTPAKKEVSQ